MVQHTNAACGCESIGVMKGEVDSSILSGSTSISLNNFELAEIVATNPSLAPQNCGRWSSALSHSGDSRSLALSFQLPLREFVGTTELSVALGCDRRAAIGELPRVVALPPGRDCQGRFRRKKTRRLPQSKLQVFPDFICTSWTSVFRFVSILQPWPRTYWAISL